MCLSLGPISIRVATVPVWVHTSVPSKKSVALSYIPPECRSARIPWGTCTWSIAWGSRPLVDRHYRLLLDRLDRR